MAVDYVLEELMGKLGKSWKSGRNYTQMRQDNKRKDQMCESVALCNSLKSAGVGGFANRIFSKNSQLIQNIL